MPLLNQVVTITQQYSLTHKVIAHHAIMPLTCVFVYITINPYYNYTEAGLSCLMSLLLFYPENVNFTNTTTRDNGAGLHGFNDVDSTDNNTRIGATNVGTIQGIDVEFNKTVRGHFILPDAMSMLKKEVVKSDTMRSNGNNNVNVSGRGN